MWFVQGLSHDNQRSDFELRFPRIYYIQWIRKTIGFVYTVDIEQLFK